MGMSEEFDEIKELNTMVARICGLTIGLLIFLTVFSYLFGVNEQSLIASIVRDALVAAASR